MNFKRILAVILGLALVTGIILVASQKSRLLGLLVILAYFLVSGLVFLKVPRSRIMDWYRSQTWLFMGTGPVDILFKQIGARITVEAFAFAVSAIGGGLGGVYWVLLRSDPEAEPEQEAE